MELLTNWIPPWLPITVIIHLAVLGLVAYLILLERKVASYAQDRLGPNRVGFDFGLPFLSWLKGMKGLGQPLADGLKFILKEDYRPRKADPVLFTLAPMIMIVVVIISIAVVPFGGIKQSRGTFEIPATVDPRDPGAVQAALAASLPAGAQLISASEPYLRAAELNARGEVIRPSATVVDATYWWYFQIARLDIGVLFVLAVLSLAVYGVVVGGWASNNKYSFLGGLRATANMISYEVPLSLAVLTIVVLFGTLDLAEIVDKQAWMWGGLVPAWNVFIHPLAFLMFLVCIHAEANRAPFDLAECEAELVGGYHTEYSSMRFAMFFLAEYAGMITTAAVCVVLFFGGWHLPFVDRFWPQYCGGVNPAVPSVTESLLVCVVRSVVVFVKTILILFVFMWVRWSLPRFRFDQLMMISWRGMIPVSLLLLLATGFAVWWWGGTGRAHMRVGGKMALFLLGVNVVSLLVILFGSRLLPNEPDPNRRIRIANSRFAATPLPASP
ncbi:MAG: NADH-quinone oxidoreductase subunit H [Phycisphaerae bacterium]|nr:NADH-quinone oxidoreductase subunit H [Phycisphaerae bacterium]